MSYIHSRAQALEAEMDMAMRDLEQIRERDDGAGRRLGLYALGTVAAAGLVFAVGAFVSDRADAADGPAQDPLARLDAMEGLSAAPAVAAAPPPVARETLTFPVALTEDQDARPEVDQALAAAGAEAEALAALPSLREEAAIAVPPSLPAAVAAGGAGRFFARPEGDALAARAPTPPRADAPAPARAGSEGAYTVQVISYETREEADAFAAALRLRGHRAFVTTADLPGRGRHFRVRIGPFDALPQAEAYRDSFEASERMATIVVRRPDETRSAAE
jgi:cell division septation protein DedD